ncbi:hypothetical protein VFPPC_18131 [Pochonia chlamydosporia 170]|uniref:Rhodopsin domain-containing protein n=1 Tax=Pochonia chlamydosporia 170 TaxID=1380566 RepID=A0A219APH2_METCM|nr:hypothetical protein VFPPC_18131 [Pochonia chlamydosporia 170]OWT42718.1 hypothetical protein VFPPC_18131 [Pochonia chlamydosporia 170]
MAKYPFLAEVWTEFALGLLVMCARIACRVRSVGSKWDGDDYLTIVAGILWTIEIMLLPAIGSLGSIKGMTDEIARTLTEEQKNRITSGSKLVFLGWFIYVTLIWVLKACMLYLYGRLTLDLKQRKLVKFTAVVCVLAYISAVLVMLFHCRPMYKNWQVYPYPGDSCALNIHSLYALAVTNISTDIFIVAIPLPLLRKVQMPCHRKLLCGLWLCTGIFVIIATFLRCVFGLQFPTSVSNGTIWSIRETVVAILAANTPVIGPWIARTARHLPVLSSGDGSKTSRKSAGTPAPGGHQFSRIERLAKENRIRRGLGLSTIADASKENVVTVEEQELQHLSHSQANMSVKMENEASSANV